MVYLHGDYYLTDHYDVLAALRDPALVCPHMDPHMYPWIPSTVSDPAEHARYRSVLNPRFTPRALAPVTAAVQDHAVALVDAVADKGACYGIADIALSSLAFQTLLTLLGFPSTDLDTVIGLLDSYRVHRDDPKNNHQRVVDYVAQTIPHADSTGVVAALLDEFDDNEITSFVTLLFTAAVDTGATASTQPRPGHRYIDRRQPGPTAALVHLRRRPAACLGVHLARAELIAIITEFLRRIPEFRTADGYSVLAAEVDRYVTHLPLVW